MALSKSSAFPGKGRIIDGRGKTKLQNALEKMRYVEVVSSYTPGIFFLFLFAFCDSRFLS